MFTFKTSIKEYVAKRKQEIAETVQKMKNPPKLVVIQVGNNSASTAYVNGKLKDCNEVGIECEVVHMPEDTLETVLLCKVLELNEDESVTGFIVQLPLPKQISEKSVIEMIDPKKDVDGFSKRALVNPATPQGIIDYLEFCEGSFEDVNAVVIGRSDIVGKPTAKLLLERNCNVTQIHSKTSARNKARALLGAELVVVATGHRNTIVDCDVAYTNPECKIIDVGINRNDDGKLCGDCENITIREKTPVPGGCGLLTRLALITNLLKLAK